MNQLKFNDNGELELKKLNFRVKHDEQNKETILKAELEKELIHGLKILDVEDRDIRSLAIYCNPNFSKGSDSMVRDQLIVILNKLIKSGLVMQEKSPKNRIIYTFTYQSKEHSKKLGVMN